MGLDMYLYARRSRYAAYSSWDKKEGLEDKTNYPENLKVLADYISDKNFKSQEIDEKYQIGYFRKFNALHHYIVEKFADGEDQCQPIYLCREEIQQLLDTLNEVKADHSKAGELLPTSEGFFFGSTEYDEWYFKDVEEAIRLCEMILDNIDFKEYDIVYQASW